MKILQKIVIPQESVNDQFLTITNLHFKTGDIVKKNDILFELESSKALITIEAEFDGYINYYCQIGDDVKINSLVGEITDQIVDSRHNSSVINVIEQVINDIKIDPIFSEKAIKIIDKEKIDKNKFKNYDFVTEDIVLKYLNPDHNIQQIGLSSEIRFENNLPKLNLELTDTNKIEYKKITTSKKREIEYLNSVQSGGLISTIYNEVNVSLLFESINKSLIFFKDSILPIVLFECSKLLKKYPILNSYYIDEKIAEYKEVNIGVAMDIDDGLKVVKISNTNHLSINEIENYLMLLADKYQEKKLTKDDLVDITFTVTDLSSNGAYFFTPLVNKNNAAILGISKIDKDSKKIIFSLSFDHRVTEGKIVSNFLDELKYRLESYILQDNNIRIENIKCEKCLKSLNDDLSDFGFLKFINHLGQEKLICDTCLFNN